jgi:hypothetical protein
MRPQHGFDLTLLALESIRAGATAASAGAGAQFVAAAVRHYARLNQLERLLDWYLAALRRAPCPLVQSSFSLMHAREVTECICRLTVRCQECQYFVTVS